MGRIIGLTFPEAEAAEIFCCPHCGKVYKTVDGLNRHIAKEHEGSEDDGG